MRWWGWLKIRWNHWKTDEDFTATYGIRLNCFRSNSDHKLIINCKAVDRHLKKKISKTKHVFDNWPENGSTFTWINQSFSVLKQQCDFLIHDMIPTVERNKVVDLTLPWINDHFAFLIPVPDETANINAVVKPFQWPVRIPLVSLNDKSNFLFDILFKDMAGVGCIDRLRHCRSTSNATLRGTSNTNRDGHWKHKWKPKGIISGRKIFGNLLSQGLIFDDQL